MTCTTFSDVSMEHTSAMDDVRGSVIANWDLISICIYTEFCIDQLRIPLDVQSTDATATGVLPQSLQSLDGIPNDFCYGSTALASERIPNRMSASRCVMTTLHLGRDDRGKENAVSPP